MYSFAIDFRKRGNKSYSHFILRKSASLVAADNGSAS